MMRLRLLGGITLERDGVPLALPERRASRSLLAWLVLHAGMHSRSALAGRFWPDVLESSARSSLRTALADLRRALGPSEGILVTTRDEAGVVRAAALWVDVWEFERLVGAGRLAEAVELCRGELMADLSEEWVFDARDAHREQLGEVLERLAVRAETDGARDEAVRWTRERVALDPLREEAQRDLIRRLAVAGDRSAALVAYERLRERLRQELGVAPSRETRELVETLRTGAAPAAPEHQRAGPTGAARAVGTVTVMFTDLVDSTGLIERLGDEQAERLRKAHFRLLRDAVSARAGHEVKNLGDGLMVVFQSSIDAVTCAVQAQQAVERHNRSLKGPGLRVRVGLHVGEPIRAEDDYFGASVVVARRLCDRAEGGQILASELVRALIGTRGGHRFRELDAVALKGIAEPVPAVEVLWEPVAERPLPLPPALVSGEQDVFVGREADLERLEALFERAGEDSRQLALLGGDPGIGKTRLVSEFALRLAAKSATVLYGRCYEETLTPYQPFVEALTHYVRVCPPETLRLQLGGLGGELKRLVPELAERLPALPDPLSGDREGERYRLFEAVSALVTEAARVTPTLVVLDDLHWADGATLALLKHVSRSSERAPLLVLGTYREIEISLGHPFAQTLGELGREHRVERLALSGLAEQEVAELVATGARRQLPPSLSRAIWEETEGNPFFVGEVVRNLAASGALRAPAERLSAESALQALGIPEGVKQVIARRLAGLGDTLGAVLTLAAVIGREFEFAALERLSDLRGDALAEALERAVSAHVLEEDPDRFGRFRFAHALIRETLYEGLTTTRRVRLHRRVAEILEELHKEDPQPRLAEIAHHFLAAAPGGDVEKAISYATRAAERATAQLAYEEAAVQYERALRALALAHPPDEGRQCELLLSLGDACWGAGAFDNSRRAFRQAGELAERLGAPEQLARAALGFGGQYVAFDASVVDEVLIELLERALGGLAEADSALRARIMARLAEALVFCGVQERKDSLARQAVDIARRAGDHAALADVLVRSVWATWGPDTLEAAYALGREVVGLADEAGDARLALQGHDQCMQALLELGDLDAARREIEAFARTTEELRQPYPRWEASIYRAMLAALEGRLDDAERLAGEGLALGQEAQHANAVTLYGIQILFLRAEQGRLDELAEAVKEFAEQYPAIPGWRCALAWVYAELGREADARHELERLAAQDFLDLPRDLFWLASLWFLCEVVAALGDRRRAELLHELLLPYARRWVLIVPSAVCAGSLSRSLGIVATTLSRFGEGARHFEDALASHAGMGARLWLTHTQYDYGRMLVARREAGDIERAMGLLGEALGAAEELGLSTLAERARGVLHARAGLAP